MKIWKNAASTQLVIGDYPIWISRSFCSKFFLLLFSEATEDTGVFCRIWALNDVAVHKSMVSADLCKNETLQGNIDNNIKGKKFKLEELARIRTPNLSLSNFPRFLIKF